MCDSSESIKRLSHCDRNREYRFFSWSSAQKTMLCKSKQISLQADILMWEFSAMLEYFSQMMSLPERLLKWTKWGTNSVYRHIELICSTSDLIRTQSYFRSHNKLRLEIWTSPVTALRSTNHLLLTVPIELFLLLPNCGRASNSTAAQTTEHFKPFLKTQTLRFSKTPGILLY